MKTIHEILCEASKHATCQIIILLIRKFIDIAIRI